MHRVRTTRVWAGCLLFALTVFAGRATAAESAEDFAKCQKMAIERTSWLERKANKAQREHSEKVDAMVAKHVARRPGVEDEAARIRTIIDKLVMRYDDDEYFRVLIREAIDEMLAAENDENFQCWNKHAVKRAFNRNLDRYERHLGEIRDAIKERLDIEVLKPDEGLVVVLFYARGYAQNVTIDRRGAVGGGIRFGPVRDGDYFRVLKVKAGKYRWHSVRNKFILGSLTAHLKKSNYEFTVEPGKLNYTGAFVYETGVFRGYTANVMDRASVVLSLLEDRYPELLDEIEIHNALNADNRFIEFYRTEKAAIATEDNGA